MIRQWYTDRKSVIHDLINGKRLFVSNDGSDEYLSFDPTELSHPFGLYKKDHPGRADVPRYIWDKGEFWIDVDPWEVEGDISKPILGIFQGTHGNDHEYVDFLSKVLSEESEFRYVNHGSEEQFRSFEPIHIDCEVVVGNNGLILLNV